MSEIYSFEKLEVWRLAVDLIKRIYKISLNLPKSESNNLSNQMKRAAVSVALNIAEGRASDSDAEFRRYLGISLKSLIEVIACIKVCQSLNFISGTEANEICKYCDKVEAKIKSFRKTLRKA
ncbi:MAG: four helix bundle protein [candidate division WOR-3 bacterium]